MAESTMEIQADGVTLEADLNGPDDGGAVIVFAHGSGSSRFSPRNRHVARVLEERGFATLLMDLLTPQEEKEDADTALLRFDVPMLGKRLAGATEWLKRLPSMRNAVVGYFGASTGAAAALLAAAERPGAVEAVVSRGGRPDLAADALTRVRAPTLLIVGERDYPVIRLNQEALARLRPEKKLEVVPGATHLFEEPGALERVALLASDWFTTHLARRGQPLISGR